MVLAGGLPLSAFCLLDARWSSGVVTMRYNFPPSGTLSNGTSSWTSNLLSAMQEWSDVSPDFRFVDGGPSSLAQDTRDGVNNVLFANTVSGEPFDSETLAITITRTNGLGMTLESDVVFNAEANWDAYDGPISNDLSGRVIFDFRRVALHELGHVFGLDHPNASCGQNVESVMNSHTSDTSRVTTDDRNGLVNIYSADNQPPVADAGPDQAGTSTQPFLLNAGRSVDPDGTIVAFEWRIDGVIIAEGRAVEVTLAGGTHTLQLTVIDNDGAADSDLATLTINDRVLADDGNAAPVAVGGGDRTVSRGTSVLLDGTASFDPDGNVDRFVWSVGGTVLSEDPQVRVVFSAGLHEVTLTVFDQEGAVGTSTFVIGVQDGIDTDVIEPPDVSFIDDVSPTSQPPAASPPCGMLGVCPLLLVFACIRHLTPPGTNLRRRRKRWSTRSDSSPRDNLVESIGRTI